MYWSRGVFEKRIFPILDKILSSNYDALRVLI